MVAQQEQSRRCERRVAVDEAWPIWASGLLGRALAAYYAGSGDPRVLADAGNGLQRRPRLAAAGLGHVEPLAGVRDLHLDGKQGDRRGADHAVPEGRRRQEPGGTSWNRYRQMPNPKPGAEKNDHVVHFLESTTPWALGYLWTGNREFLDATLAWHDLLERVAMQPSGVPVADEFYGPTGAFRGTETCDVAGYLWSQIVLLTVSGQGRMADRAERAFFNAGPATVARDFKTHVYFQSPNRVVDNSPPYPHGPQAVGELLQARRTIPLCCTAALNRIVPNYVMHMWMATYDNGLAATHYGPCKVSALAADRVPVEIVCRTDYPFNEVIEMSVKPAREATFPLSFRIPGWCKNPELSVNGSARQGRARRQGVRARRAALEAGRRGASAVPDVGERDRRGATTTRRARPTPRSPTARCCSPCRFRTPQGPNTPDPAAKWKYALDVQGEASRTSPSSARRCRPNGTGRWHPR